MEDAMKTRRCHLKAFTRIGSFAVAVLLLGLTFERTLLAFNYVVDANGTYWGIQDAASPRVDTGSIRATQIAPGGNNVPFSTQINGFGGIKVLVQTSTASSLQRRADARLWPDVRRRRSLRDHAARWAWAA